MKLFPCLLIPLGLFYAAQFLFDHWLPSRYIFGPREFQEISQAAIARHQARIATNGTSPNATYDLLLDVQQQLSFRYGARYINALNARDWVFNNAGGAMGTMFILHASVSEYVIFFGSATGTEGHTGMHFSDDYFTILQGQESAATAHALRREVYKPGDVHWMRKGDVKQYSIVPETWALELAQGWIPSMLPFGFADFFSSTLDMQSLGFTVYLTAKDMLKNIVQGKF